MAVHSIAVDIACRKSPNLLPICLIYGV